MCSLSKKQSILSRETIQNGFLKNYAPFLTYTFILYPVSHSQALVSACCALVLYLEAFQCNAPKTG